MIKETCNARDKARMVKLAGRGLSVRAIAAAVKITEKCVRRNLKGTRVSKDIADIEVDTEVVGEEVEVTEDATPAPALTPAQKAAATKKANKAAAETATGDADPEFLE